MNPVVADVSGAVLPIPVLGPMEAVGIEWLLSGRAKPKVVVDTARSRAVRLRLDAAAELIVDRLDHQNFADLPLSQ